MSINNVAYLWVYRKALLYICMVSKIIFLKLKCGWSNQRADNLRVAVTAVWHVVGSLILLHLRRPRVALRPAADGALPAAAEALDSTIFLVQEETPSAVAAVRGEEFHPSLPSRACLPRYYIIQKRKRGPRFLSQVLIFPWLPCVIYWLRSNHLLRHFGDGHIVHQYPLQVLDFVHHGLGNLAVGLC